MATVVSMFVAGMNTILQVIVNLGLSFVDLFIYTFTHQVPYQHVWSSLHLENYLPMIDLIVFAVFFSIVVFLSDNIVSKRE